MHFSQILKKETQAAHQKLEQVPVLASLARGTVDLDEYGFVMNCWAEIYRDALSKPYSEQMEPYIQSLGEDYGKIKRDLKNLGMSGSPRFAPANCEARVDEVSTRAAAAATIYLFLGARHGARVISMKLGRSNHPALRENRNFYYRKMTYQDLELWRNFIIWLNHTIVTPAEQGEVILLTQNLFLQLQEKFLAYTAKQSHVKNLMSV